MTRTWTATDDCGNAATAQQVVSITDSQVPVFSSTPTASVSASCDNIPTATVLTATDNCDAAITVTLDEVRTDGSCANSYTLTRTWTATDDCGNSATAQQVVSITDSQVPVFSSTPTASAVSYTHLTLPTILLV